jgi:hypothetical protein
MFISLLFKCAFLLDPRDEKADENREIILGCGLGVVP